jgi:hypothetical protein
MEGRSCDAYCWHPTEAPRVPISPIAWGPLLVGSDVPQLGTFTFRRLP